MESKFGDYLLSVDHISLSFGGVKALKDISFGIREKEVFAIIGPNGAGKTSMLNVINGFYHPQEGEITYKGVHRKQMKSHDAAVHGIARTFQNVALFKGMSTIDNIMTGRIIHMKRNLFWQAFYLGPARKEEMANREYVEDIIDFLESLHATCPYNTSRTCPVRAPSRAHVVLSVLIQRHAYLLMISPTLLRGS